ncbi:hypothetical protein [Desulfosporosinus orientis]|uniref:hypothetical protein n=1 Tax=Desulfosporosinus orientis TaxID=1563 RepID=UPI0002ED32EA|nr:hypothetical protein [Desulfosporosinus orientis]
MVNNPRYDFSQESTIKEKLLKKLKKEYRKARIEKADALDDDDLEMVAAAQASRNAPEAICPYHCLCQDCPGYKGVCQKNLVKG